MTRDPITHDAIDPTLARVYAAIDARIGLYDRAIDRYIGQLADKSVTVLSATEVAATAADIAKYGAAKAELIRLKEAL